MATPYLGEIRLFSFNFAPRGWALCNGQILAIAQNQALFAILGTTYGGNGTTTFALPNLQGRMPLHIGNGFVLGEFGGETAHTINLSEMPAHTHRAAGSSNPADQGDPTNHVWATLGGAYNPAPNTAINPACILPVGGSQPHENMSPYLTLLFCIALQGIFPSHN